nr:hypothetical protein [Tanacetum cinerariifolium]
MMNLTTLSLSFWDYALESATHILNMVPTKKVDKAPYELWSERTLRAPNRLCLNVEAKEHSLGDLNEPTSYKAAILNPESNKWIDAMNAKMQSMIDNMVWVLVDLPPNCKTVRTFLNGYLDEDIYMVQPEGFVDPDHPRKACKLQRSIYGLKQASTDDIGKISLDVDFFMERGTSPSTDQFSTILIDSNLFSRIFNTSTLFSKSFNTSKLFSGNFKKCRVLKLQALAWKDNGTRGNDGYVYASGTTHS